MRKNQGKETELLAYGNKEADATKTIGIRLPQRGIHLFVLHTPSKKKEFIYLSRKLALRGRTNYHAKPIIVASLDKKILSRLLRG